MTAGRRQSLARMFAWPMAIALASLVGLVSALAGDGIEDVVAWLGLALPIAAVAWALRARRS
ncbi:hypothetical protein [Sphingomonas sp. PB4P5]|uniref:hypothetical protein n=1 Tax=Parasphingomonas puruogangriensis TaxID=3096155 RepID=UPI002FCAE4D7